MLFVESNLELLLLKSKNRVGVRTFLSVEEEEGLVKGNGVIVRRRRVGVVLGQSFGDDDGEGDDEESDDNTPEGILEGLLAADDAAQVNVLVLLPLRRAEQPALLRLVEVLAGGGGVVLLQRRRRPVPVGVPADPLVVLRRRRVDVVDLQRPSPVMP